MFTNVMWATDGSAHADRALGYATRVALRDGATLHAVHVVEKFATGRVAGQNAHLDEQAIDAKIQREVADEPEEIASVLHMISGRTGDAAALIAERARAVQADLIVVGTRGHSPLVGAILGSVTQRLLHVAPCPVLVVPPVAVAAADPDGSELVSDAH
jgi:nucleotide-binding universal stress UspA family protein